MDSRKVPSTSAPGRTGNTWAGGVSQSDPGYSSRAPPAVVPGPDEEEARLGQLGGCGDPLLVVVGPGAAEEGVSSSMAASAMSVARRCS